jgi:hypothetical protein
MFNVPCLCSSALLNVRCLLSNVRRTCFDVRFRRMHFTLVSETSSTHVGNRQRTFDNAATPSAKNVEA